MKTLLPILVLLTLAGCSSWTASDKKPVLAAIKLPEVSAELKDCPRPVRIETELAGAGSVGEKQMLELWARDRATAVRCRNRLLGLNSYYEGVRAEVGRIGEKD